MEYASKFRAVEVLPWWTREPLPLGEIAIDFNRMELCRVGRFVPATSLEFRLLKFFVDHSGQVFSREELMDKVWP